MIICNCNALNERQVKAALAAGSESWRDVHDHFDLEPKCGKCRCEIIELITENRNTDAQDNVEINGILGQMAAE